MNPNLIILLVFILHIDTCSAQEKSIDSVYFSVEELQEDFDFWIDELEKHPIIYQYNSPERFAEYFDSLRNQIKTPMTQTEFFRFLAPCNAFTKCGHSQIRRAQSHEDYIMNDPDLIPLDVRWFKNRAYVSFNYTSEKKLDAGTELSAINGHPISEIYQNCLNLLSRDGYNSQYPKYWVNRQFYYYYHLFYGIHESYSITIKNNNGEENLVTQGMSIAQMVSIYEQQPEIGVHKSDGVTFYWIDSLNAAYIHVGSFTEADIKNENGRKFKKVIDDLFIQIDSANVENLIIDMQGNSGGRPQLSLYLLRYVMRDPFEFKTEILKLKNKKETQMDKRTKPTFFSDGTRGTFKPFKNSFNGNLYVLQDGGTNSSGSEFTSVIRRYKRGIIIGEESGGDPILLTGYWFYFGKKELPNTKLKYGVPHRTIIMGNISEDTGHGLIPDYLIEPTITDYLNSEDRSLIHALDLISKSKKLRTTN